MASRKLDRIPLTPLASLVSASEHSPPPSKTGDNVSAFCRSTTKPFFGTRFYGLVADSRSKLRKERERSVKWILRQDLLLIRASSGDVRVAFGRVKVDFS